jgi:hypothetical protein
MEVKIEGNKLHIVVEMIDPPELSTSGKSRLVASTRGNVVTNLKVKDQLVTIGLNAYIKEPK